MVMIVEAFPVEDDEVMGGSRGANSKMKSRHYPSLGQNKLYMNHLTLEICMDRAVKMTRVRQKITLSHFS